jgi:hypothetical protein
MESALFERLLYEEEGNALDFKRDQYPFSQATNDEKAKSSKIFSVVRIPFDAPPCRRSIDLSRKVGADDPA